MAKTRGFFDSAGATGARVGTGRGRPTFGSPSQGITRESSFAFLDTLTGWAENATGVINAVKGTNDPKPAAALDTPAKIAPPTMFGGLNPVIIWIGAAIALFFAFRYFKK